MTSFHRHAPYLAQFQVASPPTTLVALTSTDAFWATAWTAPSCQAAVSSDSAFRKVLDTDLKQDRLPRPLLGSHPLHLPCGPHYSWNHLLTTQLPQQESLGIRVQ